MSFPVIIHIAGTLFRAFVRISRIASSRIRILSSILSQVHDFENASCTYVPTAVFMRRVLRPSNEKSTVIGNITY